MWRQSLILLMFPALLLTPHHVLSLNPGDSCTRNNKQGTCIKISECDEVIVEINNNVPPPQPCFVSSSGDSHVCCLDSKSGDQTVGVTPGTTTVSPQSITTTQSSGKRISRQKCREYSKFAYQKEVSVLLNYTDEILVDKCVKTGEGLIYGGEEAVLGEFPHMALLGHGSDSQSITYDCGGSLISENFVLTAAHCFYSNPTYVLLGEYILGNDTDGAETQLIPFTHEDVTTHPQYDFMYHYYDIALIRLNPRPTLSPRVRPACLHTGDPFVQGGLTATGWGITDAYDQMSNFLLKVSLIEIPFENCSGPYSRVPHKTKLPHGILNDQQICAGGAEENKDTCQGDSGGPLQVFRTTPHCVYEIIGVVSFGTSCGQRKFPGVYARVQHFIDWIEPIVWPNRSS